MKIFYNSKHLNRLNYNWFLVFLSLFIITTGCKQRTHSPHEKRQEHFKSTLELVKPGFKWDGIKAVVVVPGVGCEGCISSVENFLVAEYQKDNSIKFVLTSIASTKLLKTKLHLDLDNPNIILDHENQFSNQIFDSIYPTIFFLDGKGKVNHVEQVSLTEDGLVTLQKQIIANE
ncbi:MAG: hypothetical protein V4541_08805 [Bacteroidota bacterium]